MESSKSQKALIVCLLLFEVLFVVLFYIFVKYDAEADPLGFPEGAHNSSAFDAQYPLFQDMHVMIFVGFGFLMTFLKKYAFSSLGFTFLISCAVMQWGILLHGFFRVNLQEEPIRVGLHSLINADIAAAVILISLGAVLGKVTPLQIFIMAILETTFFTANEYLGVDIIDAVDAGGSMYVHAFGAYFGLAVSFVLTHAVEDDTEENNLETSTYQSDVTAMIGTLFLWMFWPSFNAVLLSGDARQRAIVNTYLSLVACCMTAFAASSCFGKHVKFEMVHVQNATLAGGVCIGTAANMMVQPWGALLIGSCIGFLSVVGFRFIQDFLLTHCHLHDTCGVNNLHGMPGITAGIIGSIMAAFADQKTYGKKLFEVFPAMSPTGARTSTQQAGFQMVGLMHTLFIAIVGGLVTGLCIRNFRKPDKKFDDGAFWVVPKEDGGPSGTSTFVGKI